MTVLAREIDVLLNLSIFCIAIYRTTPKRNDVSQELGACMLNLIKSEMGSGTAKKGQNLFQLHYLACKNKPTA